MNSQPEMPIFSQLLGYSRVDLLGTSGYDYIHVDDLLQVAESHAQRNFIYCTFLYTNEISTNISRRRNNKSGP